MFRLRFKFSTWIYLIHFNLFFLADIHPLPPSSALGKNFFERIPTLWGEPGVQRSQWAPSQKGYDRWKREWGQEGRDRQAFPGWSSSCQSAQTACKPHSGHVVRTFYYLFIQLCIIFSGKSIWTSIVLFPALQNPQSTEHLLSPCPRLSRWSPRRSNWSPSPCPSCPNLLAGSQSIVIALQLVHIFDLVQPFMVYLYVLMIY